MKKKILVAEDDGKVREGLAKLLIGEGYAVIAASSGEEALKAADEKTFELLLVDLRLPGIGGMQLFEAVRERFPEVQTIFMTAYGTVETAVEAMRKGAYDFLTKPIKPAELKALVQKALEKQVLLLENRNLRRRLRDKYTLGKIVGRGERMQSVFSVLEQVAPTRATVLIEGESGTGKELVANAVHEFSPRVDKPFIKVSCAALSENLLESELFGHERGAFTGAFSQRRGRFELADKGSIFLDEIGDMNLATQMKLLRVLQEREFERVGGNRTIQVDVRVIAATHRNLREEVAKGTFRQDLFFRLNLIII